jgi:4-amino-4-deoxy-L-arabinose transferase-like glycosyltransferase
MTKKRRKDTAPIEKIDAGISPKTLKPSSKGFTIPWDSFWFNLLVLIIIIALAFSLRTLYLKADPPSDLDWSQAPFTDPPQYTTFARYKVLWGEWDVFGNNPVPMLLKSATTLVSFSFFKILGVGRWQLNFIPVLLNLFSILIIYFVLQREKKRVALFAALFLGVNYLFLMCNRCLFVENTAIFFATVGFLLFVLVTKKSASSKKGNPLLLFLSGLVLTIPPFFAKLQSAFIPFLASLVLIISLLRNPNLNNWRKRVVPLASFMAGVIATSCFWLGFVYLPASSQVSGYLSQQSLGLYGKPRSLESIGNFLKAILSFGQVSGVYQDEFFGQGTNLFFRMPIIFVLSVFFVLIFALRLFSEGSPSDRKENRFLANLFSVSESKLFFVLWALGAFVALFPWNYRPLRYQLLLVFPLCILAAFGLDEFLIKKDSSKRGKVSFLFYPVSFILITFGIFHLISFYLKLKESLGSYSSVLGISVFLAIVVNVVLYFMLAGREKRKKSVSKRANLRWVVALLVILLFLFIQLSQFLTWAKNPQYSLYKSSVDLGSVLRPDAVISGPYCSALTIDNRLPNVIHMFAADIPDPLLFQQFPITHLAMERGINKLRAFEDYPEVMKDAKIVTTYWIRNMPVDIYRIAETSGNPKTQNYQLSSFEIAKLLMEQGQVDSAIVRLNQFVSRSPQNFSGYRDLAEIYYNRKDFQQAALCLEKASQFDPTDFVTHQFLGAVYLNLYDQKRDDTYRLLAIEEWEKALKLFPQNDKLAAQLQNIKGY